MLHKTALVQQQGRTPSLPSVPYSGQPLFLPFTTLLHSRRCSLHLSQLRRNTTKLTAVLPQGLDHLVVDSTLPVLKIGVVAAVGAFSARHVSL